MGVLEHRVFAEIGDYLRPGDLLVANQSRVLPARLRCEQLAEPSLRRRSGLANYAQLLNALCEWMRLSTHGWLRLGDDSPQLKPGASGMTLVCRPTPLVRLHPLGRALLTDPNTGWHLFQ